MENMRHLLKNVWCVWRSMLTMGYTWICYYKPQSKRQFMEWKLIDTPVKYKVSGRAMCKEGYADSFSWHDRTHPCWFPWKKCKHKECFLLATPYSQTHTHTHKTKKKTHTHTHKKHTHTYIYIYIYIYILQFSNLHILSNSILTKYEGPSISV